MCSPTVISAPALTESPVTSSHWLILRRRRCFDLPDKEMAGTREQVMIRNPRRVQTARLIVLHEPLLHVVRPVRNTGPNCSVGVDSASATHDAVFGVCSVYVTGISNQMDTLS